MGNFPLLLILVFVIINVIQSWLIFVYKSLIKGAAIIGAIEVVEVFIIIFLFLKGGTISFLIVVSVEIVQWLSIAYFSTKDKIVKRSI